jgi:hypothetical protein
MAAILYYDWVLTLDIEVSSIWRSPVSASAVFFVLNRYLSIIGNVFITVFNFETLSIPVCTHTSLQSSVISFWNSEVRMSARGIQTFTLTSYSSQLPELQSFSPAILSSQPSLCLQ